MSQLTRNVRGILFRDYVRMIRGAKAIDWAEELDPADYTYVLERIDPEAWYPMPVFERLGNAILRVIGQNDLDAVRVWGRASVVSLAASTPGLLSHGDPIDTMMRMLVLRRTFFDFEALTIPTLVDGYAELGVSYFMGPMAEAAASFQTVGVFEGLLELAMATSVEGKFAARSWAGDPRTVVELSWKTAHRA
jgi:hypothetical protein